MIRCTPAWILLVFASLASFVIRAAEPPGFYAWAEKPTMGWNSWDCFATTVTESQARANADSMKLTLARHGWNLITVDIQWYEPNANGFDYRKDAKLALDEWGRLIPASNKFPSAENGRGFKPLADYVHSLGLRFGVHLMRGIPRQAVAGKMPVKGTRLTAADIADTNSICPWNGDMYGVDMTKTGAQEYYDSVFELLASWGIDFVKVDDLSEPYHKPEIEAIRWAIDRSGRPIVLSTSPGATPLGEGTHVSTHANMWRISGDFWDSWPQLQAQFERLSDWTPFRGPGHFPDADMLPLGTISMGKRLTNFTPDEQVTLLTLWSIARSPLILGADLTKLDQGTLALITNDEVIAVDQASTNNRQLFRRAGLFGWVADVPGSPDKYLALFNNRGTPGELSPDRAAYQSSMISRHSPDRGVSIDVNLNGSSKLYLVVDDGQGTTGGDDVVWAEPTISSADGEQRLTDIKWATATCGRGHVSRELSASGARTLATGRTPRFGITAHATSVIEYDLPVGATRFRALAEIDESGAAPPEWEPGVRFMVFLQSPISIEANAPVSAGLAELGFTGACRIRDLWRRKDLGSFAGTFDPVIAAHAAGLYRVSPGN